MPVSGASTSHPTLTGAMVAHLVAAASRIGCERRSRLLSRRSSRAAAMGSGWGLTTPSPQAPALTHLLATVALEADLPPPQTPARSILPHSHHSTPTDEEPVSQPEVPPQSGPHVGEMREHPG